jgi:RimJ/RimL family protein N-acetyltransferase
MHTASRAAATTDDAPAHDPSPRLRLVRRVRRRWWQRAQLLTLRRLDAADALLLLALYGAQPRQQLRQRFHAAVQPSPAWVERMCAPSAVAGGGLLWSALVVADNGSPQPQAVAELCLAEHCPDMPGERRRSGEFALLVDARWQGLGIGTWALQALTCAAQAHGLHWLQADVQGDNPAMLALASRCGFVVAGPGDDDDGVWRVQRRIPAAVIAPAADARASAALWQAVA